MYCEILLPLRLDWTPTYSCDTPLHAGDRVRVLFAGREYIGVVLAVSGHTALESRRIQPVLEVISGLPAVTEEELSLWRFIAGYYLCTLGEVYRAAYPQAKTKAEVSSAKKAEAQPEPCSGSASTAGSRASKDCARVPKPEVLISNDRLEAYIEEATSVLESGRSVLIMVPGTIHGNNLQKELKTIFKDRLRVFNSRQTTAGKRETARALRSGDRPEIIVGTRSSVFLPFSNLGLVIIDEEQDASFKQSEPNPRYNGRDTGIVLASIHGARVILGTSFASFETLLNLRTGKYSPFRGNPLPAPGNIRIIDFQAEKRKNGVKGCFSYPLVNEAKGAEGPVRLVRGWENEEDAAALAAELLPDTKTVIQTAATALNDTGHYALTAVIQADAFFDKSDFRADERALQLFFRLAGKSDVLVIQTSRRAHPVFSLLTGKGDVGTLLEERRAFNLPPYSRMIDIIIEDKNRERAKLFGGIIGKSVPDALKYRDDGDGMAFRLYLPRNQEAALRKSGLLKTVLSIEKERRYSGHVHIDVDPA